MSSNKKAVESTSELSDAFYKASQSTSNSASRFRKTKKRAIRVRMPAFLPEKEAMVKRAKYKQILKMKNSVKERMIWLS